MSDRFTAAAGRKVLSRTTAEELGNVSHLLVDTERRAISSVIVGKRRKARLLDWDDLSGFGADAVMAIDDASMREPANEHEQAAARGTFALIGKRALTDLGNLLGKIDDVTFDPETGVLETILIGDLERPAASLVSVGSFAAILNEPAGETPATRE